MQLLVKTDGSLEPTAACDLHQSEQHEDSQVLLHLRLAMSLPSTSTPGKIP